MSSVARHEVNVITEQEAEICCEYLDLITKGKGGFTHYPHNGKE
ncbi:PH domain protein [Aspergillus luchuensis]|uniref:PH domain protein n=1 Tax=Aspergillus kawachii TaxID=1069201 RepID=A0A146F707_ASPKA|nr:PH domain protein [Aspergillus luchuensis]